MTDPHTAPPRSYTPLRRPGVGKPWPPDDSWTFADLLAELAVWRSYAALRPFTVSTLPDLPVHVPAQRRPHEDRWGRLIESALKAGRQSARRPPTSRRPQGGAL